MMKLVLSLLARAQQLCANTVCIVVAPCGMPGNATQWTLANHTVDGLTATNLVQTHAAAQGTANCPGADKGCHAWNPGFSDRNGVMFLAGTAASFAVQSWPVTNGSLPVGPGQTPGGLCLTAQNVADEGGDAPLPGGPLVMAPCGAGSGKHALRFSYDGTTQQLRVLSSVHVAEPLCLAAPVPPPAPPPHRPDHWFSCTANLAGGARLPHPFCNASLPEEVRLNDLVGRATCLEKAAAVTSQGAAIPRLGVPRLGSAEDTHGVGGGCIPVAQRDPNSNSTGCPTTFPAGPGLGATFDRGLWRAVGAAIGTEARGLNNERVGPLYFLDPDLNLLRDPRWGRAQEVPGECPYLTGEYGVAVITGTQMGATDGLPVIDSRYLLAASTMKHFQIYDYEGYQPNHNSSGIPADAVCDNGGAHCGRATFDASPPARDFGGYYLGAFRTTAQRANPAAISEPGSASHAPSAPSAPSAPPAPPAPPHAR